MMEMNLEQLDVAVKQMSKRVSNSGKELKQSFSNENVSEEAEEREPSKNTMDAAVSELNRKLALQNTRCEYRYDDDTKRVTIKVFNQETGELIKEIPPEETIESIKKMWEMAGIILDEKI